MRSLNAAAEAMGVRRGQGAADARALCPILVSRPADPQAEIAALDGIARWARAYSPWVGPDPDAAPGEAGLAVEITGCAHLFGGEMALMADMLARLSDFGLTARAAVADAKGAAWGLARFARPEPDAPGVVAAPGETRGAVAPLPLPALRLDDKAVSGLTRLGVKTVADLMRLPRAAVARRFGASALLRLDQALAAAPEPISPQVEPPRFAARLSLPEPIGTRDDLEAALRRLLERLCARLEAAAMGARRLRLAIRRVDQETQSVEIGLARRGRDPAAIAPLFAKGLDAFDAGFGVDAVRLAAVVVEPLSETQTHAGPDQTDPRAREALDALLTRLGARIGFERITRAHPADTHNPDQSTLWTPAAYSEPAPTWPARAAERPPRPLRAVAAEPIEPLDDARPPTRFRWRGRVYHAAAAIGPERLTPEWWRDDPAWRSGLRDYWRVQTREGERLWLFETPQQSDPAFPRWRVAGRFA